MDVFAKTNGVADKCAVEAWLYMVVYNQMCVCYSNRDGFCRVQLRVCICARAQQLSTSRLRVCGAARG